MFPSNFGKIVALAVMLLALAAPAQRASAETIRLEISNFPTWKELEGVRGVPRAGSRLSTLERWDAQSKPYVRITNESDAPLVGFKLDLSNWDARISSVRSLFGPAQTSWKWQDDLQAALVQLQDPLQPGMSMVMRFGTAPKAGAESRYRMNQTLFSPADVNCTVHPTGGAVFSMFLDSGNRPLAFNTMGLPAGPGVQTATLDLQKYPIQPTATLVPTGTFESIPITAVPEPSAVLLAASAAVAIAAQAMRLRCRGRPV